VGLIVAVYVTRSPLTDGSVEDLSAAEKVTVPAGEEPADSDAKIDTAAP
jgi:hypothetical protein